MYFVIQCNTAGGGFMQTISLRVEKKDKELFQKISKQENLTLSNWIRETLMNAIEDKYDIELANEYLENKDKMKFYTQDEVKEILGL